MVAIMLRSFKIPFHQYGGYSEAAYRSAVADGFFRLELLSAAGNWSLSPNRCAGCGMVIFRIFTGSLKEHII